MDYVILNGEYLQRENAKLSINNRAFKYGDGIFETMLSVNNEIRHLQYHWERLEKGMRLLDLKFKNILDIEAISSLVCSLVAKNNLKDNVRVRLEVFRNGAGLYTPTDNEAGYVLEANPTEVAYKSNLQNTANNSVGFCDTIKLNYSSISSIKSCNSIPYILAAIEREKKGMDDLILTNCENFISECCSSNIFWWDGNTIFTPSIESGCIAGVMRRVLIAQFQSSNLKVEEGLFPKVSLKGAKVAFTTNCMGIKLINKITDEKKEFYTIDNQAFTNSPLYASILSLS
ncbi:MAG: aminotransferase class IV [Cytophagales bacterium]